MKVNPSLILLTLAALSFPPLAKAQDEVLECIFNDLLVPCRENPEAKEENLWPPNYRPLRAIPLFLDMFRDVEILEELTPIEDADLSFSEGLRPLRGLYISEAAVGIEIRPVTDVFRGDDVLDEWSRLIERGLICGHDGVGGEYCAFARTDDNQFIEYCHMDYSDEIVGSPSCRAVASLQGDGAVLSAEYANIDPQGGDSEWAESCLFFGVGLSQAAQNLEQVLVRVLGDQRKLNVWVPHDSYASFRGSGINVSGFSPPMFLRIFFSGSLSVTSSDEINRSLFEVATMGLNGAPANFQFPKGQFVLLDYHRHFTVSPRFSDNLIEYREASDGVASALNIEISDSFLSELRAQGMDGFCVEYSY